MYVVRVNESDQETKDDYSDHIYISTANLIDVVNIII
jgi:hypothetical protein